MPGLTGRNISSNGLGQSCPPLRFHVPVAVCRVGPHVGHVDEPGGWADRLDDRPGGCDVADVIAVPVRGGEDATEMNSRRCACEGRGGLSRPWIASRSSACCSRRWLARPTAGSTTCFGRSGSLPVRPRRCTARPVESAVAGRAGHPADRGGGPSHPIGRPAGCVGIRPTGERQRRPPAYRGFPARHTAASSLTPPANPRRPSVPGCVIGWKGWISRDHGPAGGVPRGHDPGRDRASTP
jgi:hypothetical protein